MREEELDFSRDRDASLKLISWFDAERVHTACVLVVGAGAIGNEVLKNLALMGVGRVHILDMDTIEISNLSRSVLYRVSDDGSRKAETAARAVKELNPATQVFWHSGDLETDLGEGFLRDFDVVLGCLDSVYARYIINRRCLRAGIPWIDAGIATLDGQVQVFQPHEGACYECSFGEAHYEVALNRVANSCNAIAAEAKQLGRSPTTVMIASIVAGVQVQECLKLLNPKAWGSRTLAGRRFEFSGTNASVDMFTVPEREDCPAHAVAIDWDDAGEVPVVLTRGSALMRVADFLDMVKVEFGDAFFLSLDAEFITGYLCPNCGTAHKAVVAEHKASAGRLRCDCGWAPGWHSDLGSMHTVSPAAAANEFALNTLADFGIPLGGIVELHGPGPTVRHVTLGADMAQRDAFWIPSSTLSATRESI